MTEIEFPGVPFHDSSRATRNLDNLHEVFIRSGSRYTVAEFSTAVRTWLAGSPDPDMALTNLLRFAGASVSAASLFNEILTYPLYGELLLTIFGYSQYFADVLVREPGLFRWLTASDALLSPVTSQYLRPEVERVLETFPKPQKRLDSLKRLHRRELLRIGARDILGHAGLSETTLQLSDLADAVIDAALRIAADQFGKESDQMRQIPFCVIGLGKLGGEELNYSSDIDVMFVYGNDAEGDGPNMPSSHEYFNRLSEHLVQNLSQSSDEGHLYRVDTRLRPESGAGPLARSLSGYLTYYESRGEIWERQMMIKARAVAGDTAFGEEFLHQLQRFVYPRTFAEHPATSVARIKGRIEAAVGNEANVKLMPGGIRDIEFITQTLQLVNGGKNPALRERNTLRALGKLREHSLLSSTEERELSEAYTLYRTVEHRLQTMLNTQIHTLPDDERPRESLAKRSGMRSGQELRDVLTRHLKAVREVFRQVMVVDVEQTSADITSLVEGAVDEASMLKVLAAYGFADGRAAARQVRFLISGSTLTGVKELGTRSREAFRSVARPLFAGIAMTADPDFTLRSVTILAGAQKIPDLFYMQLGDDRFRRFVLDVCAVSPRFARGLAQHPLLLETFASDPDALGENVDEAHPHVLDLVGFKVRGELRAGIRHILGFSDFDQLTGELSTVATSIIRSVLSSGPRGGRRPRVPLAIFAMGKLGTAELGFDGDLDLLFVGGDPDGSKSELLETTASDLLQRLSTVSPEGRLYDVDVRLRPEGKNAPLVVESGAYTRYLASRSSLWERQSLTRLRFLAGDPTVGNYVTRLVASHVFESPLPRGWNEEIVAMRRKMETSSRTRGGTFLDLKLGAGGMADVEFIVQMMQMKYGNASPPLRGQKVIRFLRSALDGILTREERELLASGYAMERRIELLTRIGLEERGTVLPEGESLNLLARLYDGSNGSALESRVETTMKKIRSAFLGIAGRLE